MKTITFLSNAVAQMRDTGTPADISVGTFNIHSTGSLHFCAGRTGTFDSYRLSFELEFRPDHIQMLRDLGVSIDLDSAVMADLSPKAKRFKQGRGAIKQGRYAPYYYGGDPNNVQTGVVENWLHATATAPISVLGKLDAICRDNHLHHLAIHNDYVLVKAGLKKPRYHYITPPHIVERMNRHEVIRKQVRKLNSRSTTPYVIACKKKYTAVS